MRAIENIVILGTVLCPYASTLPGGQVGTQGAAGEAFLPDDPADHRGILSWHSQKGDRKLREAGSYGYLVRVPLPRRILQKAESAREFTVRLEVDSSLAGGLAVYGSRFGRYPLDPTLVLTTQSPD